MASGKLTELLCTCLPLGAADFQLRGGGGSIEPPKTGGGSGKRAQLTGPLISHYELWCRFLGLGHLRGPGVSLSWILGVPSIEPLFRLRLRLRYPGACTGLAVVGGLSQPPSTVGAHPRSGRAPLCRARHRAPREPTPRSGCLVRLREGGEAELGVCVGGRGVVVPSTIPTSLTLPLTLPHPPSDGTHCPPTPQQPLHWAEQVGPCRNRGKGSTRGNRAGQTAPTENVAERNRRGTGNQRKNHRGCYTQAPVRKILRMHAGAGKLSMDSECASGCTWSTAWAMACLWNSRPQGNQTRPVIRAPLIQPDRVQTHRGPECTEAAAMSRQIHTRAPCQTTPPRIVS